MHNNSISNFKEIFDTLNEREIKVYQIIEKMGPISIKGIMAVMHTTNPNNVAPRVTHLGKGTEKNPGLNLIKEHGKETYLIKTFAGPSRRIKAATFVTTDYEKRMAKTEKGQQQRFLSEGFGMDRYQA